MSGRIYEADYRELTPDHKNANKGTKRGRDLHQRSMERLGAGRSIVVDQNGRVIAGNKTLEVAHDLEMPLRVIETHGDELVVVKRLDLDLEDDHGPGRELAYADNRVGQENLNFALDVIEADRAAGVEAVEQYWFPEELDAMLGTFDDEEDEPQPHENLQRQAEPATVTYSFAEGDTIILGPHKLIVGSVGLDEANQIIKTWENYTGFEARIRSREEVGV